MYPLQHVRVVELTTGVAGAYATKLLRDLGATVVKIEPSGGDPLRRATASGHALGPDEDGVLFQFLNGGKIGVAPADGAPLIAAADIVVTPPSDIPIRARGAV